MQAIFLTSINVVEAAVERSGCSVGSQGFSDSIEVTRDTAQHTRAVGDPHAIMRLIGALADDGQDCLVSAS